MGNCCSYVIVCQGVTATICKWIEKQPIRQVDLQMMCYHHSAITRLAFLFFLKVRRIPISAEDGIIMDYAPQDESGPSGNPRWLA